LRKKLEGNGKARKWYKLEAREVGKVGGDGNPVQVWEEHFGKVTGQKLGGRGVKA